MGNLIGWIASRTDGTALDVLAKTMIEANPIARINRLRLQVGQDAGVAVDARPASSDVAALEGCLAVIIGRPRWAANEFAEMARKSGDAAALIYAFERDGEHCLEQLRGDFSLAVLNTRRKRALIAVDRYGIHSLCYALPPSGGLVFGTRTDAVRAHPAVAATVSEQTIFNYFFFGVCPSPGTIYREQSRLLPAQYLLFEEGRVRTGFYWRMPYRERTEKQVTELVRDLMDRLSTAIDRAVRGQLPSALGAFLSGGLDSSTVAGLLSRKIDGQAKTFTIGFAEQRYDESGFAEIASQHFGTEHHVHRLSPKDVAQSLVPLAQAFDEPFGNSSVVPAFYCAKMAQESGVTRILAGDGGDELFGGNSRYVDQLIFESYGYLPASLRQSVIEPVLARWSGTGRWKLMRKAKGFVQRACIPLPDRLESGNFYGSASLDDVFTPSFLADIDPGVPLAGMREVYERTISSSVLQRMLHLDLKLTLADNDLKKVNVACELADISVVYPFLDDDVVEFSASIPDRLLIRRFERRWFFKKAIKSFLPPEILAKRKHGFGMPFAEWPREHSELREIAAECISSFSRRGYCQRSFLDRFLSGQSDRTTDALVWDIVMLELWLQRCQSSKIPIDKLRIAS